MLLRKKFNKFIVGAFYDFPPHVLSPPPPCIVVSFPVPSPSPPFGFLVFKVDIHSGKVRMTKKDTYYYAVIMPPVA